MAKKKARNTNLKPSKKRVSSVPVLPGVVSYTHKLSLAADPSVDKNLRGDPFLRQQNVQYIAKNDYTTLVITGSKCTSSSEYSAGAGKPMRCCWVPPMIVRQPDKGQTKGAVLGDERGVFADIGVTKVAFKNVTKQPLKIIINSPRGRISDPGVCYLRRYKREIEIGPGKTKWFTANWGDHANIFTPLTATIGIDGDQASDKKMQVFVIYDFAVVANDVDEMSGKKLSELGDQSFVEVRSVQRFISTASYGAIGDVTFEQRNPFVVTKLDKMVDMMIESPVVLSSALASGVLYGRRVGDLNVLHQGPVAFRMGDAYEDRVLVLAGVAGYFKVVGGNLIKWDVLNDQAEGLDIEPFVVAPGCRYDVLPTATAIKVDDIISWLTTVTKILTVVSALV